MGFTYSVLGAKPLITPTIKVSQAQFHVTRGQTAIGTLDARFVHFIQYNYSRLDKIIFQFFNPTFGKVWSKSAVRGWGDYPRLLRVLDPLDPFIINFLMSPLCAYIISTIF